MEINRETSGYGSFPMDWNADATMRSNDSAYNTGNSPSANSTTKQDGKIKAYVDFTEFNRNYEAYLQRNGLQELDDSSAGKVNHERTLPKDVTVHLERQNSSSSSTQSEGWEVITCDTSSNSDS